MNNKVILTDIDGVCLDWEQDFNRWMIGNGHILVNPDAYKVHDRFTISTSEAKKVVREFNESAKICFLKPFRDSVYYIKLLHEKHGFVFHCVTSLTKDPAAQELRKMNLQRYFGQTAFEKFIYADTGSDKDEVLMPYKNTNLYWIEDKPINAELGIKYGLKSILMFHKYNEHYTNEHIIKVINWKGIYDIIMCAQLSNNAVGRLIPSDK